MHLTPAQSALARRAVRTLLRYQIAVLSDGTRPAKVLLDYDEAQALLVAAAACPDLGLSAADMDPDLGPFIGPGQSAAQPVEPAWHCPT